MKQITMEVQSVKDIQLLLQLAERLHIKTEIRNKKINEPTEKELRVTGLRIAEESFKKDWENEDDAVLLGFPKKKVRVNWEKTFRLMADSKDDKMLNGYTATAFDKDEWKW